MKKQTLIGCLGFCLIAGLMFGLTACGGGEQPVEEPAQEEAAPEPAKAEEPAEVFFTRLKPGPWAGKEDGHVPGIKIEKAESGIEVTVSVNHEMNPETPHYIMWIRLEDGEGRTLGEKKFSADAEGAEAVFSLAEVPAILIALEECNLHGIWKAEIGVAEE